MLRIQSQILKESKLRSTSSRSKILGLFLTHSHALSYSDIEREVGASFDRVTVYRTLKSFLEKGIIHKILDDTGGLKYGLCDNLCSYLKHQHDHVHFKCTQCGQTSCLNMVEIPGFNLPNGYKVEEVNLLIQGMCSSCA
ncbi:MAG TPA: transcriptional repressor [Cytophagales bacterium]|nr:transcriptional repressor [Cytophagales bacterium]HCR53933.1 transcriptional repressor [Cytophagales bacterium]